MCQWGTNGWAIELAVCSDMLPITDPYVPLNIPNQVGVEASPFQIAVRRLEIDENVNRTHLRTHWLAVN